MRVRANVRTRNASRESGACAATNTGERASFYAADDRLIGTDVRSTGKRLLEEYRYDALGRRIWVSTDQGCAPNADLSCVTDGVTRTIWDGSDEVAEIRAPLGTSAELNAAWPVQSPALAGDPNPFYGRVVYGPGVKIDEPMSVTRYEYRDFPFGGSTATWPTYTLLPFWDYRGTPVYGVFSDGATALQLNPGGTACPNHGTTSSNRCVALAWKFSLDAYRQELNVLPIQSWHGSVLANKKDGSGLHFMRNRVYDPGTGRFTQEDPIGLAGGLNTYGFAGGDPINSADPFGLCPTSGSKENNGPCPSGSKLRSWHNQGLQPAWSPLDLIGGGTMAVKFGKFLLSGGPSPLLLRGSTDGPGQGRRVTEVVKDQMERRAGGKCEYCGRFTTRDPKSDRQRHTDHGTPRSRGGDNSPANLVNSCKGCNLEKGTMTVLEYLGYKVFRGIFD